VDNWLVIGGGNGGQATAGHLAIMGEKVRLYDIFEETCEIINSKGGIQLQGVIEGFGKIEFATTDMGKALKDATNVIIVAPAFAHADIAKKCAPFLTAEQMVLMHPSTMFGSIEFSKILKENGNNENIAIGETISLLYAARLIEAGAVNILGIKNVLPLSVFPSSRLNEFSDKFTAVFPQLKEHYENVLEIGLQNLGCVFHPLPTLMSTSLIESDKDWLYYYDGISESVGKVLKDLDNERVAIGHAVGLNLASLEETMKDLYGVSGNSVSDIIGKVEAYAGVKGQKNINTRYLTEEIPYALIPMISLAKKVNVNTPIMEAAVVLAESVLQQDLHKNARTLESVGIGDMDMSELMNYLETGKKK